MKKFILMLLVVLSLNIKAEASTQEVYYSDYSDFSEFSEIQINSSELVDVENERRYRWYKNNEISEYLLYDEGIDKYEFVDMENYKLSEFGDWKYEKPISITGRTIEEKEEYVVKRLKPIQTLFFRNFSFDKEVVDLGEIEIYVNEQKVDYKYVCGGCSGAKTFESGAFIMIDFNELYYLQDITIKINSREQEYINSFIIHAVEPEQDNGSSNIYATYNYENKGEISINIIDENFDIINPRYEEELLYELLPNISNLDYVEINTKYRYQDKYYYFYNIKSEYIDGYYVDYPGYIKDEKNFIDYYRYRTREKIIIENEMTITRYKESLDNFIVATTDYEIETDINYLKNGIYSVRYITPFQTITKEVTVDIEENELRQQLEEMNQKYNNLENDYNSNQIELEELKNTINNKNQEILELENINIDNQEKISVSNIEYQKLLDDYNLLKGKNINTVDNSSYLNSLKDANEKCNNDLVNMKLRNEDNEKKLKLSNQANDYLQQSLLDINQNSIDINKSNILPFILIGLVILLAAIIIIKKMSSKN